MSAGGGVDRDAQIEPLLLIAIRRMAARDPHRHVRIVSGSGTTVGGFVREVDDWLSDLVRRERAAVLRETAGDWPEDMTRGEAQRWLTDRATQIEEQQ